MSKFKIAKATKVPDLRKLLAKEGRLLRTKNVFSPSFCSLAQLKS